MDVEHAWSGRSDERRNRFAVITARSFPGVLLALTLLAGSGCGSEEKAGAPAPASTSDTPSAVATAPSQPSAGAPPRPVEQVRRFENNYFIVDLPVSWRVDRRSPSSAVFTQRHGGALIRARVVTNTSSFLYARRLRKSLGHDRSVHLISVRKVPFGARAATRLDFRRGPLHQTVFVVDDEGHAIHVQADVPQARYPALAGFLSRFGDYFGFVDID